VSDLLKVCHDDAENVSGRRRLLLVASNWVHFGTTIINASPSATLPSLAGDAENARHEIVGHENAAPECKGGKCET